MLYAFFMGCIPIIILKFFEEWTPFFTIQIALCWGMFLFWIWWFIKNYKR
jgi:hypothetical protein